MWSRVNLKCPLAHTQPKPGLGDAASQGARAQNKKGGKKGEKVGGENESGEKNANGNC